MRRGFPTLLALAALAALPHAALPHAAAAQGARLPPFVEARVPKAPAVATGGGASFLVYELHVTNFGPTPLTLQRLEVLDAGRGDRVLAALADSALGRALARPGLAPAPPLLERARLGGGLRAVAYLWVPVDGRTPPTRLRHRITLAQGAGDSLTTQTLDVAPIPVTNDVALIGPPLRGGNWLAANGPDAASGHRRALIPVDGVPAIAQRFAIDWLIIGDDDRTNTGDASRNETHHAEGKEAIAVADGIVAVTKDGIPENVPGITSRAVPITLETVGGNHVILDIGRGRYAFYAHLKPGSLRVKPGDRVKRGQVLGLVGSSGNSTEPHLHFHVMDGTSPLGSEGVPYVIDGFELLGRCRELANRCERSPAPERRQRAMPVANEIVRFP